MDYIWEIAHGDIDNTTYLNSPRTCLMCKRSYTIKEMLLIDDVYICSSKDCLVEYIYRLKTTISDLLRKGQRYND